MKSLNKCRILTGKPEMTINLYKNKNDYFPNDIIKGNIKLKSHNFFHDGIINYEIYTEEKIVYKIKKKLK